MEQDILPPNWTVVPEDPRPYRYLDHSTNKIVPFPQFYNSLLLPPLHDNTIICRNTDLVPSLYSFPPSVSTSDDAFYIRLCLETKLKAFPEFNLDLDLLYCLFCACRVLQVTSCDSPKCAHFKASLRTLMPSSPTWPGLGAWALQLAACMCAQQTEDLVPELFLLSMLPATVLDVIKNMFVPQVYNTSKVPLHHDYLLWADSVYLPEIFGVMAWLNGVSTGTYEVIEPSQIPEWMLKRLIPGKGNEKQLMQAPIDEAIERYKRLQLCPHRIWAIAGNLSGREANLPAMIPTGDAPVCGHTGHEECSYDFCGDINRDSTTVKQLHACGDPPTCRGEETPASVHGRFSGNQKHFSRTLLHEAAREPGRCTAWSLDGRSIMSPGLPFMAISHVWADGTGAGVGLPGQVNECLWDFFCAIARRYECAGIWWDVISVPTERIARNNALNNMHKNYADAKITLLHDLYLRNFEWSDAKEENAEGACFAITMSTWFTRGWTALELAKSRKVKVLFKDLVIKDLDEEILAQPRRPSSMYRQVASTSIRGLRNEAGIADINALLTSFGSRFTSKSKDRALIAGLLVGVENPHSLGSAQEIYQNILKKFGKISTRHLFHGSVDLSEGGFSWCPTNLFDLPVISGAQLPLTLHFANDGSVEGVAGFFATSSLLELKRYGKVRWENMDPAVQEKLKEAFKIHERHLLLTEMDSMYDTQHQGPAPGKGVVVKVMRDKRDEVAKKNGRLLFLQFVGLVEFVYPDHEWHKISRIVCHVMIGDMNEKEALPEDMIAMEYVKTFEDGLIQTAQDRYILDVCKNE